MNYLKDNYEVVIEPMQVLKHLQSLGVDKNSQFGQFFLLGFGGYGGGPNPASELFNIEQIAINYTEVDFLHDSFGLGDHFITISDVEGEGAYLYNKLNGSVYDLYLRDIEKLKNDELEPRWKDFNSFLLWNIVPE